MKCSLGISNFLEEISSLSHSIAFLYFFALITEDGFLISPCYSLELCNQIGVSFLFSLPLASLLFSAICKDSSDNHFAFLWCDHLPRARHPGMQSQVGLMNKGTSLRTKLEEVMEFQLSYFKFKRWCCTQYDSKFGKLSSGHRIGKGQFSFQFQKKAMPKDVQTTTQMHSFHTLVK